MVLTICGQSDSQAAAYCAYRARKSVWRQEQSMIADLRQDRISTNGRLVSHRAPNTAVVHITIFQKLLQYYGRNVIYGFLSIAILGSRVSCNWKVRVPIPMVLLVLLHLPNESYAGSMWSRLSNQDIRQHLGDVLSKITAGNADDLTRESCLARRNLIA